MVHFRAHAIKLTVSEVIGPREDRGSMLLLKVSVISREKQWIPYVDQGQSFPRKEVFWTFSVNPLLLPDACAGCHKSLPSKSCTQPRMFLHCP